MSQATKILFDMRPVRTPISGVARYCLHLAEGLEKMPEFRLSALYYGTRATNTALAQQKGLTLPAASTAGPKLLNSVLEFAPFLSPLVMASGFDLVHETFFANVAARGRARKVSTIHDVIPLDHPEYVNSRNRYFSRKNFARQCHDPDRIIAVSAYTKSKIIELGGVDPDRITVIPCGVTPMSMTAAPADYMEKAGLAGRRYVLCVGNIEPRKNIGLVVEALATLGPSFDDVQMVVAGHKNYLADEILADGRARLGSRFHFLGHVSEAEKWNLLKNAAIFVFPSLYEGFGIPVVEAYQAGCPVLLANNSSLTELAVDPRQLFASLSAAELKSRMEDVLDQASWVGPSVAAGTASLSRYNWEKVAQDTAAVYRAVLGRC